MNLLFIAYNFEMGGVQRALVNTLKELYKTRPDLTIELFAFSNKGILSSEIPSNIKIISGDYLLGLSAQSFKQVIASKNILDITMRIALMGLVRIVKSEKFYNWIFKRQQQLAADIVISYFNDVPTGYFNKGCNKFALNCVRSKHKIAWIHTDPEEAHFNINYSREVYKLFNKIVCVSLACKNKLDRLLPEFTHKTSVVYNFFPIQEIQLKAEAFNPYEENNKIRFVTVARIDNSCKRIDRILNICHSLNKEGINNFEWYVVGDGPQFEACKKFISDNKLETIIKFVGNKVNPFPYIKNANLFVFTSAFEGYGMVIAEALILRTPVLTTNYTAVHEQIKTGVNGIITPNSTRGIYNEVKKVLSDITAINKIKDNLKEQVFNNQLSSEQFNELLIGGSAWK